LGMSLVSGRFVTRSNGRLSRNPRCGQRQTLLKRALELNCVSEMWYRPVGACAAEIIRKIGSYRTATPSKRRQLPLVAPGSALFASSRCADARCPTLPRGLLPQGGLLKDKVGVTISELLAAGRRSASERRAWLVHVRKRPSGVLGILLETSDGASAQRIRISNLAPPVPLYMVTRSGATLNFLAQRSTRFFRETMLCKQRQVV
jgi:hypothetical protein